MRLISEKLSSPISFNWNAYKLVLFSMITSSLTACFFVDSQFKFYLGLDITYKNILLLPENFRIHIFLPFGILIYALISNDAFVSIKKDWLSRAYTSAVIVFAWIIAYSSIEEGYTRHLVELFPSILREYVSFILASVIGFTISALLLSFLLGQFKMINLIYGLLLTTNATALHLAWEYLPKPYSSHFVSLMALFFPWHLGMSLYFSGLKSSYSST